MPQVRKAWENFITGGGLADDNVRAVVAQSWQRSAGFRISAEGHAAPLANDAELYRHRAQNAAMIAVASPALQRSRTFLTDAQSMLILADHEGFIVAAEGDLRVIDAGRENHLELGGIWQEKKIGTNAIGTALAEGIAVQIHGSEHYCESVQRWTCAAVPLKHPANGKIVGVIDVSGKAECFNPQSMALAVAVGGEIEAAMHNVLRTEHEALLRKFLMTRSLRLSDDIVVLDRYGLLVHSTRENMMPPGWRENGLKKNLEAKPILDWQQEFKAHEPNADLEFVRDNGEPIGAIVILRAPRIMRKASTATRQKAVDFDTILGESPALHAAKERATLLAQAGLPILIEGETGTGKELFAQAIHAKGRGADTPFIPVNCGGIARDLIGSELFGYQKGSFTGADDKEREGRITAANGGTLCLDEIGEMPLDLQPYLLRVLEDGIVFPLGGHEGRQVDLSLVSMTNRSLLEEVSLGRFRNDLYYRIATATVSIPPLRARGDDVKLLADYFSFQASQRLNKSTGRFTQAALDLLMRYPWPGNVRELKNVVETAVALAPDQIIDIESLPVGLRETSTLVSRPGNLKETEKEAIMDAMRLFAGNATRAARHLGIARSTLYLRLSEYGWGR